MNAEIWKRTIDELFELLQNQKYNPKTVMCNHQWVDTGFKLRWCKKAGCKAEQVFQNMEWVDVKMDL